MGVYELVGENHVANIGKHRNVVRLADKAASDIRRMILNNQFDPGEPLSEPRLAQMLCMSRTPIREAITMLEQEGLLRIVGGKGAFVVELDKRTFQEINDLRYVLEPLAAVSSMYLMPQELLDRQKAIWAGFLSDIESGLDASIAGLTEADDEFHFSYIDMCENARLRNFLRILRFQTSRYIYAHWGTRRYAAETAHQHLDIITAFENRDADALRKTIEVHIGSNNSYAGIYDRYTFG